MATPTERLENWDEFEIGAVLKSFDENGNYSRDHSKTYKVADWRVINQSLIEKLVSIVICVG